MLGCEKTQPKSSVQNTSNAPADVSAAPSDALKTDSGLWSKVLRAGTGTERPTRRSRVTVHYTGWTTDGASFDSSVSRGEPSTFGVSQVIPGWTEGLQLMVVGEKRRFWIPETLAYKGQKGMPAGMLVFDVELIGIEGSKAPSPVVSEPKVKAQTDTTPTTPASNAQDKAPADVAAPPADATRTATGLSTKILKAGTGSQNPTKDSVVTLEFKGWTTDGRLFDSSRGQSARMPVQGMIPGLVEGLQLMVEGESRRFWVPEPMAYKGQAGYPKGTLVFDITMLKIDAAKPPPPPPKDVAGPPADAIREDTGLYSKILKVGSGETRPSDRSAVMVRYTAWTTDGSMFETTETVGDPAVFPLVRVIPGFSEGLKLMVVGEKRRLWIPEKLGYLGAKDRPQGMLVYDVELLDLKEIPNTLPKNIRRKDMVKIPENEHGDLDPSRPPSGFTECHDVHCHHENGKVYSFAEVMRAMKAKDVIGGIQNDPTKPLTDVAVPQKGVETTESGIRHMLLFVHKKHSEVQPEIDSLVTFHFSGWTSSGTSFLSSVVTGRPVKLPLVSLPSPGLQEAIQNLKLGEKRRFWIPESATGRDKGMEVPAGDLIYDIELIDSETL